MLYGDPDHELRARRVIWGIIQLIQQKALKPNLEVLEKLDPQTMAAAISTTLVDALSDLKRVANAT